MNNAYATALVLLTLAAGAIGGLFYTSQLSTTPWWLWIFVPDCPLYALLAAPILLFGIPKSPKLRFIVACGLALFGSWTIFVLALHAGTYFNAENFPLSIVLVAGHAGMMLEALLVMPKKSELKIGAITVAVGWFLINLNFDYFNGALSTHPWIPQEGMGAVIAFTAFGSLFWPIALFASAEIIENDKTIAAIRKALRISG